MFETGMFLEFMELFCKKCHKISTEHGFWEGEANNNIPTKLCLMHSEISEWLEAFRKGNPPCEKDIWILDPSAPDGKRRITSEEEEAADLFIRLGDLCQKLNIDLGQVSLAKMAYNEGRPHMHGGKKC